MNRKTPSPMLWPLSAPNMVCSTLRSSSSEHPLLCTLSCVLDQSATALSQSAPLVASMPALCMLACQSSSPTGARALASSAATIPLECWASRANRCTLMIHDKHQYPAPTTVLHRVAQKLRQRAPQGVGLKLRVNCVCCTDLSVHRHTFVR